MQFLLIIFFCIQISINVYAQADTTVIPDQLDVLLEEATYDSEDSQIFDSIEYLINNPIDINKATVNELKRIPLLNYTSALILVRERNLLGGFTTIEQLRYIKEIPPEEIERILPFLKIESVNRSITNTFEDYLHQTEITYRFRTINDLQLKEGFADNKYLGSKPKYYNRIQLRSSNIFRAGILTEKDAGEKSLTDFTSFHLNINKIAGLIDLTLGDYTFEFGQGLALWGPYSFSKGSNATSSVSKNGRGVVPYLSADENQFMRGGGFKLDLGKINFSGFISYRSLDASIDTNTNKITSLPLDGYHRTENELNKKDKVAETIFGFNTDLFISEDHKVSLLYFNANFSNGFIGNGIYKPSGNNFRYFSLGYSSIINNLYFSGEFANNKTSIASINNVELSISRKLSLVFSYRNYPKNFISLKGSSFGEKLNSQNETGFYTGLTWRSPIGTFNIYYDQYKFSYTSSNYVLPSNGNEFLIFYENKFSSSLIFRLRYKYESQDLDEIVNGEYRLIKLIKNSLRPELSYQISKSLQLRTRIEYLFIGSNEVVEAENGFLIFQDVKYSPINNMSLQARIILFSTDSYNSRIYQFENDLPGVMTNPALYGEGMRWYLTAKYKTNFGLIISLKYTELYKPNERTLGSSYSKINGNIDNRLSLQLDYIFR